MIVVFNNYTIKYWSGKMKKNSSRRKFFSYFGRMALLFTMPFSLFSSSKIKNEEEYIFINGWLLKKEDLNDI